MALFAAKGSEMAGPNVAFPKAQIGAVTEAIGSGSSAQRLDSSK